MAPPHNVPPTLAIRTSMMLDDEESSVLKDAHGQTPPTTPLSSEVVFFYPEGGWVAWTQVLVCFLTNMITWGYPGTYGVYQRHYTESTGLSSSQVSWIGSVQVFLAFGICTVSGRLTDAGYSRHIVLVGSSMTVLGTFLTSACVTYWQILLTQGVFTGLGMGVMFMPGIAVVGSYFKQRRSLALGLAATGSSAGGVVFPATLQYLIPRIGFSWAVRCQACVALVVAVVAIALIKPRLAPRKKGPLVEWGVLREPPYVLFAIGSFFLFWALYFGYFYINVFARQAIGFTSTDSVSLLLILNGMGVPGRAFTGFVADRYLGPINTLIISTTLLSGVTFAWSGVSDRTGMFVFSVCFGLSIGFAQGVFVGSLASLTEDPQKMGTRFGMVATVVGFATLAGPPTAGAIIDATSGQFLWAQVWGGGVTAMASATLVGARLTATGLVWKAKV